jgi:hypothetical protein
VAIGGGQSTSVRFLGLELWHSWQSVAIGPLRLLTARDVYQRCRSCGRLRTAALFGDLVTEGWPDNVRDAVRVAEEVDRGP